MNKEQLAELMKLEQFPLSAKYDINWLNENEMGPCSAWLAEYLFQEMSIKPGMRILDLGCGKALSSIFIAKEYGAQVWATDLWIKASENFKRIVEMDVGHLVFPINAEAHALPYADGFFDAIVSLDAYHYFGTDEMYLSYISRFLKQHGQIGIVIPGVSTEWTSDDKIKLTQYWEAYHYTHHTPEWWKELWERSDCVKIDNAENMPNGYTIWHHWDKTLKDAGILKRSGDVEMLELDGGNFTFTRIIATKI